MRNNLWTTAADIPVEVNTSYGTNSPMKTTKDSVSLRANKAASEGVDHLHAQEFPTEEEYDYVVTK